jgi:uncharacterized protein (TIGR00255 family)
MTAYGRGEHELDDSVYVVEIKSLNNRYRDIILRIPRNLQILEDEIRSQIYSKVRRGRVEVAVQVEKKEEDAKYNLELNSPLINAYLRVFSQLKDEFGIEEKITIDQFCQLKDVIISKPEELDIDKSKDGIQAAIGKALESLDEMRIQEGAAIEKDFISRLGLIEEVLLDIEKRSPLVVEDYRSKLREKIDNISQDIEVDESRLVQEIAIFAGRSDITEEIVRIKSHLEQFRNYIYMDDSIGRRLDFLIQELNREVNTIGSKVSDSTTSTGCVEIKAELEKLREQIQNVE